MEKFIARIASVSERNANNNNYLFGLWRVIDLWSGCEATTCRQALKFWCMKHHIIQERWESFRLNLTVFKVWNRHAFPSFWHKGKEKEENAVTELQPDPFLRVKGIPELQRICASTENGCLPIPLFMPIVEVLWKWWNCCFQSFMLFSLRQLTCACHWWCHRIR